MSYSRGPYAEYTSLPPPDRPTLGSSRKIDFRAATYAVDGDDGGMVHMPTIAQLVALAVADAVQGVTTITPQEQERTRQRIRDAIKPWSKHMSSIVITVERTAAGVEKRSVSYRDTSTGLDHEVAL